MALGEAHGYRNAQVTVLAPTGTIGLVMDCDTTGIEPDFALVKFKKLAGGGYFKIINQSIPVALRTLGYSPAQIDDIVALLRRAAARSQARPYINHDTLRARGFDEAGLARIEQALAASFDITFAFNALDARRGLRRLASSASAMPSSPSGTATCSARSASPRPRSRRPTTTAAAP